MESLAQNPIFLCFICYYATALLVQLPKTLGLRTSLLPLTLYLAYQGFSFLEPTDHKPSGANYANRMTMLVIGMRATDWTFRREPLRRFSSGPPGSASLWALTKNTIDLANNLREIGWTRSGNYKPQPSPPRIQPTSSTPRFILRALVSALIHFSIGDCLYYFIHSLDRERFTDPYGASLFDSSLSPIPRYLLSSFLSALMTTIVYCGLQLELEMFNIIFIVVFGYSPQDCPPMFNYPWLATSVVDFWSRRWHQAFRRQFIQLGIKPLAFIVGRESRMSLLGGFVISGIFHGLQMWRPGEPTDFIKVCGYFISQGVGVILESTVLKRLFGGKVDGWKGRIWTMCWALIWSNMYYDVWCRIGSMASYALPEMYRPSVLILGVIRKLAFGYI